MAVKDLLFANHGEPDITAAKQAEFIIRTHCQRQCGKFAFKGRTWPMGM